MDLFKHLFLNVLLLVLVVRVSAQTTPTDSSKKTIYTGVYNNVKSQFPFPLLGFVNQAEGNQSNAHIGFTNLTADTFKGVQVGLVNKVGTGEGDVQVGMVNLVTTHANGVQVGMMNMVQNKVKGAQVGFVNLTLDSVKGTQIGYVNAVKGEVDGAQVGFVNALSNNLKGTQIGFVNAAGQQVKGAQVGYINAAAKTVNGVQVGFINIADSFGSGIPIGFLSFVKRGGYYALEFSGNETFHYNLAGKIGVKPLYTIVQVSHQPSFKDQFAFGYGFGSIVPISKFVRFNPELVRNQLISKNCMSFTQFSPSIQFGSDKWAINVGPNFTWANVEGKNNVGAEATQLASYKPQKSYCYDKLDAKNALYLGAKVSLIITL